MRFPTRRAKVLTESPASVGATSVEDEVAVIHRIKSWGVTVTFGAPTRCPECGNYGLVEQVNDAAGVAHERCLSCGHTWVVTKRAVAAAKRPSAKAVEGGGVLVESLVERR